MVCTSVKAGTECSFMSSKGCLFNGGNCYPITENCEGCQKVMKRPSGNYCLVFPDPAIKWRLGNCSMATHMKVGEEKKNGKINPLKASKRRAH